RHLFRAISPGRAVMYTKPYRAEVIWLSTEARLARKPKEREDLPRSNLIFAQERSSSLAPARAAVIGSCAVLSRSPANPLCYTPINYVHGIIRNPLSNQFSQQGQRRCRDRG